MAESIVKVPSTAGSDFDFLAFSFNGLHSWDDFKIYRTISGDRHDLPTVGQIKDITVEVPGGDGLYYFESFHREKKFSISFAFDNLTEIQLSRLKQWLNGKELGDLWFEEAPYKVYTAKVTGKPTLKVIPFERVKKETSSGTLKEYIETYYKGEGNVEFTAFWPYAHTPHFVQTTSARLGGQGIDAYSAFRNSSSWQAAVQLPSTHSNARKGENKGELPAPFVLIKNGKTSKDTEFRVGEAWIKVLVDCQDLNWDSKTGLVTATMASSTTEKVVIPCLGEPIGAIPIEGLSEDELTLSGATLTYHYWYY